MPAPGRAEVAVDLEIVIASDVSISMDTEEKMLQQQGFVDAFRHPGIVAAIQSGPLGRIAVTYFEWGGDRQQRIVVPWTMIDSEASAWAFARRLEANRPASLQRGTSVSAAVAYSHYLLRSSDYAGQRRLINLSGDGENNSGRDLYPVRHEALGDGIVINGLPIIYKDPLDGLVETPRPAMTPAMLVDYFEREVIGGPGAFIEPVRAMEDYPAAILRKLYREIKGNRPAITYAPDWNVRHPTFGIDPLNPTAWAPLLLALR